MGPRARVCPCPHPHCRPLSLSLPTLRSGPRSRGCPGALPASHPRPPPLALCPSSLGEVLPGCLSQTRPSPCESFPPEGVPRLPSPPGSALRASSGRTGRCSGDGLRVKNNPFPEPKRRNETLLGFASWGCPGLCAMAGSVPAGWDRTCSARASPAAAGVSPGKGGLSPCPVALPNPAVGLLPPRSGCRTPGTPGPSRRPRDEAVIGVGALHPLIQNGDEVKAARWVRGCGCHQRGEKGRETTSQRPGRDPSSHPPARGAGRAWQGRREGELCLEDGLWGLLATGQCQPRTPLSIPTRLRHRREMSLPRGDAAPGTGSYRSTSWKPSGPCAAQRRGSAGAIVPCPRPLATILPLLMATTKHVSSRRFLIICGDRGEVRGAELGLRVPPQSPDPHPAAARGSRGG